MAGMFRKIKEDGRLRRTMAAWLGICIVVQMVFGSLGGRPYVCRRHDL